MTTEIYTKEWHRWHKWTNDWSTRALFGVFAHLGVPEYFLDVGCADGHLVKVAAALGAQSVGYDSGVDPEIADIYALVRYDLTEPLTHENFDLVICWEVAEHLPSSAADTLCDSLAGNVAKDGHLVFTAAVPGQGGHGHINEQPHAYWRQKLEARGMTYDGGKTEALRATWGLTTGPCWWYPNNCMVLKR